MELNITNNSKHSTQYCLFEYLYFMRPKTIANNISVSDFRIMLGKLLVKEIKEYHTNLFNFLKNNKENIIVSGIPKSGIIQAKSFAQELNLNYNQIIEQNENYQGRTFILENNIKRQDGCFKKYKINEMNARLVKNKIIILIDDSIVRGNTIKHLINFVKTFNPKQIHFMVSAPPIINICQYGVDFPNIEELVINQKSITDFERELNIITLSKLECILTKASKSPNGLGTYVLYISI